MRTGLERPDAAVGPAAQYRTHDAVQVLPGQLPNVVQHQTMANIEQGISPVQTRQGHVGGVTLSCASPVSSSRATVPGRPIINRVAVSVIYVEEEAMAHLFLQCYLKRVIV